LLLHAHTPDGLQSESLLQSSYWQKHELDASPFAHVPLSPFVQSPLR
jgi:hypothetical protein